MLKEGFLLNKKWLDKQTTPVYCEENPTFNPIIRSIQTWQCLSVIDLTDSTSEYVFKSNKEIHFIASYLDHEVITGDPYQDDPHKFLTTFRIHRILSNKRSIYLLTDFL